MNRDCLALQNIPISLTPEQRRIADLLREQLLEFAYGRGWRARLPPVDYAALERRVVGGVG